MQIGAEQALPAAEWRHRLGVWARRGDHGEVAAIRGLLGQCGQAADVMAPAHREGYHAMLRQPLTTEGERMIHEPKPGQVVSIPDNRRPGIPYRDRCTRLRHAAMGKLLEIG